MAGAKIAKTLLTELLPALVFLAACAMVPNAVWADISESGSINPTTSPTTWNSNTPVVINGTLTVTGAPVPIVSGPITICSIPSASGSLLQLDGTGTTWTTPATASDYIVGIGPNFGATATITIQNGAIFNSGNVYSGGGVDSMGTLNIFGATGATPVTTTMNLYGSTGLTLGSGNGSTGNLNMSGGSILNVWNGNINLEPNSPSGFSYANAYVDGPGTQLNVLSNTGSLNIGGASENGYANLYITNGASVYVGGATTVGTSTHFDTGNLYFGNGGTLDTSTFQGYENQVQGISGPGSGTITTHGYVGDTSLTFGSGPVLPVGVFNYVAMNLNMSNPNRRGDLGLGDVTSGALTICNGVTVYSANGWLGVGANSVGNGTVTGSGSTWNNSGTVYVGYDGTGTLNITNGGAVVTNSVVTGQPLILPPTGVGTVNFDGGILRAYNAANGGWLSVPNVYVKEGGAQFDTNGYAMGIPVPLQHGGSNPIDGGITKLGAGTLTLSGANTYTGPTTVDGGVLELGMNAQNSVLGGGAHIVGGAIVFDYPGGVTLSELQKLLTAPLLAPPNTPPLVFLADGSNDKVTVESTLPGDCNLDGKVDGSDLGVLINNMGLSRGWTYGDFNYDGKVDGTDLGLLVNNMGQSAIVYSSVVVAGSHLASVPEPATLVLLASGLIGLIAYARRKRK